MKIAILGAGFAGLSLAWHLLHESKFSVSVDIYDSNPIGSGASGNSSGLLNPYTGLHARKAWEADIGMDAAHELISAAANAIATPIVLSKGIFRPACSEEQKADFLKTAEKYKDVEWWHEAQCHEKILDLRFGSLKEGGGIYIKSGVTLNIKLYLEGLWQAVAKGGGRLIQKKVSDPHEIGNYDWIAFCLGADTLEFFNLPIKIIKGQLLKIKWPENIPPLPFSLVGKGYLVMSEDHNYCYAGATFEKEFLTKEPDREVAKKLILEKILPFFPALENGKIVECIAGLRATTASHLPIVEKFEEKYCIFTALGSKGVLWHSFLGQRLAKAILYNDSTIIPKEVQL